MSSSLAILNGKFSGEEMEVIKNTVARGATDTELAMFLSLAHKYQLDVFAKELYFIKMGGTPTIFASRDGYLSIAHRSGAFDGMISDVVYEGDIFKRQWTEVEHEYSSKRGRIIGAYAVVYRSDRKIPTYAWAPWADYNKGNGQWKTYPHAMLLKVAEALALKRAFGISGLVMKEELDVEPEGTERISAASRAVSQIPSTAGAGNSPIQKTIGEPRRASDLERDVVDAEYIETVTGTSGLSVDGTVSPIQEKPAPSVAPRDTEKVTKETPKVNTQVPTQDPRIAIWGKYLKHYGNDTEKAKAKIAELLNSKPSKDWDLEDLAILDSYLREPAVGEKEEDFKGIPADKPAAKPKAKKPTERDALKESIAKLFVDEMGMKEAELIAWLTRTYKADSLEKLDTGILRKILKSGQEMQAARDEGEPDPE